MHKRSELTVKPVPATKEATFKAAILAIIERGEHPSAVRIRQELGRPVRSGMINGRETTWRRELLTELGWTRGPGISSRWKPPEE